MLIAYMLLRYKEIHQKGLSLIYRTVIDKPALLCNSPAMRELQRQYLLGNVQSSMEMDRVVSGSNEKRCRCCSAPVCIRTCIQLSRFWISLNTRGNTEADSKSEPTSKASLIRGSCSKRVTRENVAIHALENQPSLVLGPVCWKYIPLRKCKQ